MTSRPPTTAPILAVLAIVLVTLGANVGGYFSLCAPINNHWMAPVDEPSTGRSYNQQWMVSCFTPAGWLEA
jgi:hypothetical protein